MNIGHAQWRAWPGLYCSDALEVTHRISPAVLCFGLTVTGGSGWCLMWWTCSWSEVALLHWHQQDDFTSVENLSLCIWRFSWAAIICENWLAASLLMRWNTGKKLVISCGNKWFLRNCCYCCNQQYIKEHCNSYFHRKMKEALMSAVLLEISM